MVRFSCALLAGCLMLGISQPTYAGEGDGMWHNFWTTYRRNNAWPYPFVEPDRCAVQEPFNRMVVNGWRRQNLIGNHHFAPDNGELTQAGKLKLRWIVTQVPPQFRTIFVESGENRDATLARIDAVQRQVLVFQPAGDLPDVRGTHLASEGRPAVDVDDTQVRYRQSRPAPVLPAAVPSLDE